jgi:hypothetical protein
VEEVRVRIGADSLEYLSPENLTAAIAIGSESLCLGCFTRDYPIEVQLPLDKFALERPIGLQTAMVFPEVRPDDVADPVAVEDVLGSIEARQPEVVTPA